MTRKLITILGIVCTLSLAAPAGAQSHLGLRAGVSGGPGQFVVGGHVETKPLLTHLTFRPNLEVGVGDNQALVGINLEFAYWVPISDKPWSVYVGGGPAAVIRSFFADHPRHGNGSDVGGGFNVLVGVQHRRGLFVELKVGAIDSPSVKFMVGYVFR
jgi:hypothetical protein